MRLGPVSLALLGLGASAPASAQYAYVVSLNAGAPWGSTTPTQAMDLAFGAGTWSQQYFETASAATLFSASNTVVYLEGSDYGANELQTFLGANQALIEAWVAGGGGLFLNCAPNEGGAQAWGFGGVSMTYPGNSASVYAAAGHPVFAGPFLPTGTSFYGTDATHAYVSGPGLSAVFTDDYGRLAAAELSWGGGLVVFGGLTTTNWWSPSTEALNVRANLLTYLESSSGIGDPDGDGVESGVDNCPDVANQTQVDGDGDGVGDACDACPGDPADDADGDTVCGDVDNCPGAPNPAQADVDGDGVGDACDACLQDPDNDADGDGVCGNDDNCPTIANADQADSDGNGTGDACEGITTGAGTGSGTGSATGGSGTGAATGTGTGTGSVTNPEYAKLGGCGCATGSTPAAWTWLAASLLFWRRKGG